jgi:hypothetical protein
MDMVQCSLRPAEAMGKKDLQEPPAPGDEPLQLKPRSVGRKRGKLPPMMKGTELSGA